MAEPPRPPTTKQLVDRALASANEAVRLDSTGDPVNAFTHYRQAVTELEGARALARSAEERDLITTRLLPYLARAEALLRTVPALEERRKRWEAALVARPAAAAAVASPGTALPHRP